MNKETHDEETHEYTLAPGGVLNIKRKMGHLPQIPNIKTIRRLQRAKVEKWTRSASVRDRLLSR